MVNKRAYRSQRLVWIEGIRFFGVALLLLYHAQLVFTVYAYTPQPTGLVENIQKLFSPINNIPSQGWFSHLAVVPIWFGFQFVDVFVLLSGFCLVLSQKGKPLQVGEFLRKRLLRLLFPFWTVVVFSFPVLCALRAATGFPIPSLWQMVTAIAFPLMPDFSGEPLQAITSAWGLMPLIISFALVSPLLWYLLQRWGTTNLLLVSGLITVGYRVLTVYQFGGHPAYALQVGPGWHPFFSFLAKLSTFVMGMVAAHYYCKGKGPVCWRPGRALGVGIVIYAIGFICQFYRWGWVFADLLLPIGLSLVCMVVFRAICRGWVASLMLGAGAHSYSYFLLSSLVVDYTIRLVVREDVRVYLLMLPAMVGGTLVLAILADYVCPALRRLLTGILQDADYVMTRSPIIRRRMWTPEVGESVRYQGRMGWKVIKVETLLDEREFLLCQVSDGQRSVWVNEDDLEPIGNAYSQSGSGKDSPVS